MNTVKRLANLYDIDYEYTPYFKEKCSPDGDADRSPPVIILMGNIFCDIFVECNNKYYNVVIYRDGPTRVEIWFYRENVFRIAKYPRLAEFIDKEYPELTVELAYVVANEMKVVINKMLDDRSIIKNIMSKLKHKSARG